MARRPAEKHDREISLRIGISGKMAREFPNGDATFPDAKTVEAAVQAAIERLLPKRMNVSAHHLGEVDRTAPNLLQLVKMQNNGQATDEHLLQTIAQPLIDAIPESFPGFRDLVIESGGAKWFKLLLEFTQEEKNRVSGWVVEFWAGRFGCKTVQELRDGFEALRKAWAPWVDVEFVRSDAPEYSRIFVSFKLC